MDIENLHESADFDCPVCGNSWYVYEMKDGLRYAKPCKCRDERIFIKEVERGGIAVRELKSKTLANFKTDEPWQKEMKDIAEQFLKSPESGVGFFGKSGVGKTHICFAILLELMREGRRGIYFPYRNAVRVMVDKMFHDVSGYQELMEKYSKCDILYIDDLFKLAINAEGQVNKQEMQVMYELINNRYINHKLTIFSSEFTTKQMIQFDEATASRIYSMCKLGYYCKGENQRFQRRLY